MSRQFQIEVGGVEYKGNTASAKNQFEALHIAMRTAIVAHLKGDPSEMTLAAMLGAIEYSDLNRLVSLLVKDNVVREADSVEVAENLFADNIQDYYLLIGRVIQENLRPFWKLRRPGEGQAAETESP